MNELVSVPLLKAIASELPLSAQRSSSSVSPHWPKALVQSIVFQHKYQPAEVTEVAVEKKQP